MKINELFESRDKKKRLSHMRNLFAIACADGSLDESEKKLLSHIGANHGLTTQELTKIINRPDSIDFTIPETKGERIEQLFDMVLIMMANGDLHEKEMSLCRVFAIKLGYDPTIIDKIVDDIWDAADAGLTPDLVLTRLMMYA